MSVRLTYCRDITEERALYLLHGEAGGKGDEMGRQRRDRQTQAGSAVQHSSSLRSASLPVWENTALSVHSTLSEKPPLSPLQHGSACLFVMRDTT